MRYFLKRKVNEEANKEFKIDLSDVGTYKVIPFQYGLDPAWIVKFCDLNQYNNPEWIFWNGTDAEIGICQIFRTSEEAIEKFEAFIKQKKLLDEHLKQEPIVRKF